MAAVARFFIRGANSKLSVLGIGAGAQSSYGTTLLKLSATCNTCTKPQRRHVAHFTFQPDPVPSQYGEWLANRLTLPCYQERFSETLTQVWDFSATKSYIGVIYFNLRRFQLNTPTQNRNKLYQRYHFLLIACRILCPCLNL